VTGLPRRDSRELQAWEGPGWSPGALIVTSRGCDRCSRYLAPLTPRRLISAKRGEGTVGLFAAKNAILVAAQLHLGHTATALLLHMALECWDNADNPERTPPRRYFAGREASALALGFLAPDNASEAAHRAVKRAVKELVDTGAITRVRSAHKGTTAEFELNLDSSKPPSRATRPVDNFRGSGRKGTNYSSLLGTKNSSLKGTKKLSQRGPENDPPNSKEQE
jgi:uncharacterized protein (DUF2267 family)